MKIFIKTSGSRSLPFAARVLLLLVLFPFASFAEELSWTTDLISPAPAKTPPSWLQQLPSDGEKVLGEARFEITPPAKASDLLITVTFNEKPGGFLKVFWSTPQGSQMLSENLYEGIDMPNQRSLLVSQLVLKENGILTFQSSQEDLQVYQIHWQWLEPKVISAADDAFAVAVLAPNGKTYSANDVSGDSAPLEDDSWKGNFITAPLTEKPERVEQGIEFQADLETLPRTARLEGFIAGLPLDKNLTVWINGHALPSTLEVPNFTDPGYQGLGSGTASYVGWRKLQLWLPSTWFQTGTNKIEFSWEDQAGKVLPIALKNLHLQLNFGATKAATETPGNGLPAL